MQFKLVSPFQPTGDQPQAIQQLTEGILSGAKAQTLLGVTGSGKTFTIANVIKIHPQTFQTRRHIIRQLLTPASNATDEEYGYEQ